MRPVVRFGDMEWVSMETVLVHCGELGVDDVDDWMRLLGVRRLWVSEDRWWVHRYWYELALHAVFDGAGDVRVGGEPIVWDDEQWDRACRLAGWYNELRKRVKPLQLTEDQQRRVKPLVLARRVVEEAYRDESRRIAETQGFAAEPGADRAEEVRGSGVADGSAGLGRVDTEGRS